MMSDKTTQTIVKYDEDEAQTLVGEVLGCAYDDCEDGACGVRCIVEEV